MKTVLITGVGGLLGNNLARYLLDKGYCVIGIDDMSGCYEEYLPKHQNFIFYKRTLGKDDISKDFALTNSLSKIDCVFHFAAYAAEGLSPFIRHFNYQNNIMASADIINECIKHNIKLVFASSMAVYGEGKPPFTEASPCNPIDPYGIAKYATELDIKCAARQFGLRYTIVRPQNVHGIYQNIWDRYRNVVGIFIRKALNNEPLTIFGDGQQTRAISDVRFYMEPFEKLIERFDGVTFNIGADMHYSINTIADIVSDVSRSHGIPVTRFHYEPRHEAKHSYGSHELAKKVLWFKDETNLRELVETMFAWAKEQPNRVVKDMDYEVDKGLYSYWK